MKKWEKYTYWCVNKGISDFYGGVCVCVNHLPCCAMNKCHNSVCLSLLSQSWRYPSSHSGFGDLGTLSGFFSPVNWVICLRSTNKGRIFSPLCRKLFFPAELYINPAWCHLLGTGFSKPDCDFQSCKHAVCLHRAEHGHLIFISMTFVFWKSIFIKSYS